LTIHTQLIPTSSHSNDQHFQSNPSIDDQANSNELEPVDNHLVNSQEQINQSNETASNQPQESRPNLLFNELSDFIHDENTEKHDLAAAFLAAFYSNSNTQQSLKDYLDLVNHLILSEENQLPSSFAGLISLLNGKKQKLDYEKSWYCDTCKKLINKLDNRFQRECNICNSRFYFFF